MKFELINREVMVALEHLTGHLERFRGLRSLWADQAANHEPSGVSTEALEQQQMRALSLFLSHVETLRKMLGCRFGSAIPDEELAPGHYAAMPPTEVGKMHLFRLRADGVCVNSDDDFPVGSMVDLFEDGWRFCGPLRLSVFE